MKLIGKTKPGVLPFELAANIKRASRFTAGRDARLVKLTVYLDGLGSGSGDQSVRGIIYDAVGLLLGWGDEVLVRDGTPPGWVDLPFRLFPEGVAVHAGNDYYYGLHVGGPGTNSIRVYGDAP